MIMMIGSEVLFLVCLLSSVSMVITQGMMNAVGAIGGGHRRQLGIISGGSQYCI